MVTGWRYRLLSVFGVCVLVCGSLLLANHSLSQGFFTTFVPLFNRLEPTVLEGESLWWAFVLSVLLVGASLAPLYRPQPSRLLDTVFYAQQRVIVAGLGLAAFGYFKWSHRLPRATLTMTIGLLLVVVPLWFVWIRRRPTGDAGRTLIVGDDFDQIRHIGSTLSTPAVGYLSPAVTVAGRQPTAVADGGVSVFETGSTGTEQNGGGSSTEAGSHAVSLSRLGGLSRLGAVLIEHDIDTVVLAFRRADRGDFFGALDVCHRHGVNVKVHREYADSVLLSAGGVGELVDVDLEPWDPQEYVLKRLFDVAVAGSFLLLISPIAILIILAIKTESKGPVFFTQQRTYMYGETFTIRKFRTLIPKKGGEVGTEIADDRRTKLGSILRTTHLDEIPQLWSILIGEMSVVGPRPAQTKIESNFEKEATEWRKRWFVKPGLTGLAQINDATSQDPREKIQYDLQYIRNQSLFFDLKILLRQLWAVVSDTTSLLQGDESAKK